jgi:hypothetical protein
MSGGSLNIVDQPPTVIEHHHFHHGEQGLIGAMDIRVLEKSVETKEIARDKLAGDLKFLEDKRDSSAMDIIEIAALTGRLKFAKDAVRIAKEKLKLYKK